VSSDYAAAGCCTRLPVQRLKHECAFDFSTDGQTLSHAAPCTGRWLTQEEVSMDSTNPYVYINDDEIELKQILILYGSLKKQRKFTVSEAEKRGFVKVESMPHEASDENFSKAIAILDKKVRLCLSTRVVEH
jgi:hypothetical protein